MTYMTFWELALLLYSGDQDHYSDKYFFFTFISVAMGEIEARSSLIVCYSALTTISLG
jgi:hypothetical protein